MSKNRKYVVVLTVAMLMLGTLTAVVLWGTGPGLVLAAPIVPVEASKSVSTSEIAPGQSVGYTLVVTNTSGSDTGNITVVDGLDADLTYVVSSAAVAPLGAGLLSGNAGGTLTFTVLSMTPGKTVTITFDADLSATATPASTIDNVANVYSGTTHLVDTNTASFNVSATPDLQIYSPESGAVVTQQPGQTLAVTGRVWAQFNPAPFPGAPVLQPITNFGGIGNFTVSWNAVADAAHYVLQESSSEGFDAPTTYPAVTVPTASQFVTGKSAGTYYYRVAAYNALSRPSRWSNVEVVTVTSASLAVLSDVADNAVDAGVPDLTIADALVAVQVSSDGSTWHDAILTENPSGWWDWTYTWTLPEGDGVQQAVLARASYTAGGNYGTDTVTVTLRNSNTFIYLPVIYKYWPPIPYAPVLNDVSIIGDGNDFRVSWTYNDNSASIPDPIDYRLQQASDAAFTANLVETTVTGLTTDLMDRSGGAYYYRVRGRNAWGFGPWSDTKSVLLGRDYQFTSSTEGWFIARSDEGESQQLPAPVWNDGKLYHLVWGKADFSILSPMQPGPVAPYTLEAKVDIVDSETVGDHTYKMLNGQSYGIIFGGNNATPCPATRYDPNGCLNQYYRILVAYDMGTGTLKWQLKRIEYHEGDSGGGAGRGTTLIDWGTISGFGYSATGYNTWRVEVTRESSNNIKIFFNDHQIGTASDRTYIDRPYFGTFLYPTNELGGVATKWEYFKIQ